MKRSIGIYAITLVIAGLLITSASGFSLSEDVSSSVSVKKLDLKAQTLELTECQTMDMKPLARSLDGSPVIEDVGDQLHPSVAMFGTSQMLGFRDDDIGQIVYYFTPDGITYDGGIYWETNGDYPYNDYWKNNGVIGTFVCDYLDLNGGATYHMEAADMTDTETYTLTYWDWSGYGWSNMIDACCAAATNDSDWWWGVNSFVMDTSYGDYDIVAGPFIHYQTAEDGYATISWYDFSNGAHCDADVDMATMYSYAIYDIYNDTSGLWEIFLRCDNTQNWDDESDPVGGYIISDAELSFEKPVVAANDDNIVIVAESAGEIVCQYSSAGPTAEFSSVVIGEGANPAIEYVTDEQYAVIFTNDGKLYKTLSEDSGATWTTPEEVATNVVDEYRAVALGDGAGIAMYQYDGADVDIYSVDIFEIAQPIIKITNIAGGFGKVTATVTNIGTADAENVDWTIAVEGGLVFGGAAEGTLASVAVDEEVPISSGFIIGFGALEGEITAGFASESISGSVLLFFVNIDE